MQRESQPLDGQSFSATQQNLHGALDMNCLFSFQSVNALRRVSEFCTYILAHTVIICNWLVYIYLILYDMCCLKTRQVSKIRLCNDNYLNNVLCWPCLNCSLQSWVYLLLYLTANDDFHFFSGCNSHNTLVLLTHKSKGNRCWWFMLNWIIWLCRADKWKLLFKDYT